MTFSCVVQNGHYLYWDVEFSDPAFSNINRQRFLTSDGLGNYRPIGYAHGHTFEFNLTSNLLGTLNSTATTIAEPRLEGTRVSCQDINSVQKTSVIHIVQGESSNTLSTYSMTKHMRASIIIVTFRPH